MNGRGIMMEQATALTPHNKALYEAGKVLMMESIGVAREFCKFMITTCIGAVPIYLGLMNFVLKGSKPLSTISKLLCIAPPVFFIIASIVFAVGYLPQEGRFSLDIIEEIERERTKTIKSRMKSIYWGFGIFLFSATWGIIVLGLIIFNKRP